MSSVSKGPDGINIQYDSLGDIVRLNFKLKEDEDALERDLVEKIWVTYDTDRNGQLSLDEVECFFQEFFGSNVLKKIDQESD